MDQLVAFLNSTLVAPLWTVCALAGVVFLLTVYRSLQAGNFDVARLPRILDTLIVAKVLPLALLGIAAVSVTDETTRIALVAAYTAGAVAAAAGETKQLIDAVIGRASQNGSA